MKMSQFGSLHEPVSYLFSESFVLGLRTSWKLKERKNIYEVVLNLSAGAYYLGLINYCFAY